MLSYFEQGAAKRVVHAVLILKYMAVVLLEKLGKEASANASDEQNESTQLVSKVSIKDVWQFIQRPMTDYAVYGVQLCLVTAVVADPLGQNAATTSKLGPAECILQALAILDEHVTDPTEQCDCIIRFVGTLTSLKTCDFENFNTVAGRLTSLAMHLTERTLQIKSVVACSHLFSCDLGKDLQHCLQCLLQVLKTVDIHVKSDPTEVGLWVDMLDQCMHYHKKHPEYFSAVLVKHLRTLCVEQISFAAQEEQSKIQAEHATQHLNCTEDYIQLHRTGRPDLFQGWEDRIV